MSMTLRILLAVGAILAFIYMALKLRKEQLEVMESLFWVTFFSVVLIMSLFPKIVIDFAQKIGVDSPANLVYLVFIFFLIVRVFLLSIRMGRLETKLNEYIINKSVDEKIEKER